MTRLSGILVVALCAYTAQGNDLDTWFEKGKDWIKGKGDSIIGEGKDWIQTNLPNIKNLNKKQLMQALKDQSLDTDISKWGAGMLEMMSKAALDEFSLDDLGKINLNNILLGKNSEDVKKILVDIGEEKIKKVLSAQTIGQVQDWTEGIWKIIADLKDGIGELKPDVVSKFDPSLWDKMVNSRLFGTLNAQQIKNISPEQVKVWKKSVYEAIPEEQFEHFSPEAKAELNLEAMTENQQMALTGSLATSSAFAFCRIFSLYSGLIVFVLI